MSRRAVVALMTGLLCILALLPRTAAVADPVTIVPPTVNAATVLSPTSVQLTWRAAAGDEVMVRRSATAVPATPSDGDLVYDGPEDQVTDVGLAPRTKYYYGLFAHDGTPTYSTGARTYAVTWAVTSITEVRATSSDKLSVDLSWTLPDDPLVAGVVITDEGNSTRLWTGQGTTAHLANLEPGTKENLNLYAEDAAGNLSPAHQVPVSTTVSWTAPTVIDPFVGRPRAVACSSDTWCMSIDGAGRWQSFSNGSWGKASALVSASPRGTDQIYPQLSCAPGVCAAASGGTLWTYRAGHWSAPTTLGTARWMSISCVTSTWCMAIATNSTYTVWNGTSWRAPSRIGTFTATIDGDVACQSTTRCFVAVSTVSTGGAFRSTWNGSSWAGGSMSPVRDLHRISCSSSTSCLAATDGGLTYVISATTWSRPVQGPSGLDPQVLSCAKPTVCLAAQAWDGHTYAWTGAHWSGPANVNSGAATMRALSCPRGGTRCVVADELGRWYYTVGSAWHSAGVFDSSFGGLTAASCPSATSCLAVDETGGWLSWTGTSWRVMGHAVGQHAQIACAADGSCLASSGQPAEWRTYVKGAWGPVHPIAGVVQQLTCASASFCLGVVTNGTATGYVYRFTGTSATPISALTTPGGYVTVACTGPAACMAVNYAQSASRWSRWNGSVWSSYQTLPGGAHYTLLACPSASSCITTADDGSSATWTGTSWTGNGVAMTNYRLGALGCSASVCAGAHHYSNDTTPVLWTPTGGWRDGGAYAVDDVPQAIACSSGIRCQVFTSTSVLGAS